MPLTAETNQRRSQLPPRKQTRFNTAGKCSIHCIVSLSLYSTAHARTIKKHSNNMSTGKQFAVRRVNSGSRGKDKRKSENEAIGLGGWMVVLFTCLGSLMLILHASTRPTTSLSSVWQSYIKHTISIFPIGHNCGVYQFAVCQPVNFLYKKFFLLSLLLP